MAEESDSSNRNLLLGGLIVETEACPECNPSGKDWLEHPSWDEHTAADCVICLAWKWIFDLQRAVDKATGASLKEQLQARARLKATFPGHPREPTPRSDCFSTEEFVLREGRAFPVQPLDAGDLTTLRTAHEALKQAAGGVIPTGESWESHGWATMSDERGELFDVPLPPEDHVDPWTNFAVAQFAWETTAGKLSYVEGFVLKRDDSEARPRATAWNLVGGKVAEARACTPGKQDHEYFGVVLDHELRVADTNPIFHRLSRVLPFSAHLYAEI